MRALNAAHGRGRAAYTLIEMVLVVGLIAAASSAAVGLMRTAMRAHARTEAAYEEHHAVESFAEHFRRDVAGGDSSDIDVGNEGSRLVLAAEDTARIAYATEADGIARLETSTDGAMRSELYTLPISVTAAFGIDRRNGLVTVHLVRSDAATVSERSRWTGTVIEAAARRGAVR